MITGKLLLRLEYNMAELTLFNASEMSFVMTAIFSLSMKYAAVTRIFLNSG